MNMKRKLAWFLVIGIFSVVALYFPAYAAVESVKVSGDVSTRYFYRKDYDLGSIEETNTYNGSRFRAVRENQDFFQNTVRVNFDASLTDNLAAEIQLLNQRVADPPTGGSQGSALASGTLTLATATAPSAANDEFDVLINHANVTIKEFLYAPMTLTVGRQNLQWGGGMVLGTGQLSNPDPNNVLAADEFSVFNSFDAIHATIDLDPWFVDAFGAQLAENAIDRSDDTFAAGIYTTRAWGGTYSVETDFYAMMVRDAAGINSLGDTLETTEQIYALGTRGSLKPTQKSKVTADFVFQVGKEGGATNAASGDFTVTGRNRQDIAAWALDARAEYLVDRFKWPTLFGLEYVWYSGEDRNESGRSRNYRPLFRGKYHSAIREFQGYFYFPGVSQTPSYTNQHAIMIDAAFNPFNNKDITLFARFLEFWFDTSPLEGRDTYIGSELDISLKYAYTEDLSFSLINGWFFPGDYFTNGAASPFVGSFGEPAQQATETAMELVGEVTLSF